MVANGGYVDLGRKYRSSAHYAARDRKSEDGVS